MFFDYIERIHSPTRARRTEQPEIDELALIKPSVEKGTNPTKRNTDRLNLRLFGPSSGVPTSKRKPRSSHLSHLQHLLQLAVT
jgi:hypothetical protein